MSNPQEQFQDDENPGTENPDETQASSDEVEVLDWGGGELEEAYLKAMMALEASDTELPQTAARDSLQGAEVEKAPRSDRTINASSGVNVVPEGFPPKSSVSELATDQKAVFQEKSRSEPAAEARLTPRQILEACLFVGGSALASGKLATMLRGDYDSDFIDREIDVLNRLYASENRPYEIRLGEGGYRLTLRDEYERIRYKVYGLGPKEVRLSQESLEVLAIVAYHQPIRQSAVEELGKPNCGAVLRQLVRRELLAVERDPDQSLNVNYKTTPRFLSLFGIRNLDELPRHEQVGYK